MICKNFVTQKLKLSRKKAFSLLELSIVLIISALIVSAALTASTNNLKTSKNKITHEKIREIYKSIGNFLAINKRLPCPASLLKSKISDSDYGSEVGVASNCNGSGVYKSSSNANLVAGMVPIKSLGLSIEMAEDSFDSKFLYIIDKNFANISSFDTANYNNIMKIIDKPGNIDQIATNDAIIVILSHGNNGNGAFYTKNGSQKTSNNNLDSDEIENQLSNLTSGNLSDFNNIFIASSGSSEFFDDILFYKERNQIIQDFNLFDLIFCQSITEPIFGINWARTGYSQIAVSTNACLNGFKPTRRCGAFGVWQEISGNICT